MIGPRSHRNSGVLPPDCITRGVGSKLLAVRFPAAVGGTVHKVYDLSVPHKPEPLTIVLAVLSLLAVVAGWMYFVWHYGP
jgi:hypothetical protein